MSLCGMVKVDIGCTLIKFLNIASVSSLSSCIEIKQIFLGINCTKADLEAIIDGNDDVELLDFEEGRLWYETSYK